MKNRSIAFMTLMGLFMSVSVFAQQTQDNQDDTTPKALPKYAAVNGYHAGNYKQPHKAKMAPVKNNLIAAETGEATVALNYKMPHNKTEATKVSAPAENSKVNRNYKMPYSN